MASRTLSISSLEVAEMVGRDHNNVMKDIRRIIEQLGEVTSYQSYFTDILVNAKLRSVIRSIQKWRHVLYRPFRRAENSARLIFYRYFNQRKIAFVGFLH